MSKDFNLASVVLAVLLPVEWTTGVIYLMDFQTHLCTGINLYAVWKSASGHVFLLFQGCSGHEPPCNQILAIALKQHWIKPCFYILARFLWGRASTGNTTLCWTASYCKFCVVTYSKLYNFRGEKKPTEVAICINPLRMSHLEDILKCCGSGSAKDTDLLQAKFV